MSNNFKRAGLYLILFTAVVSILSLLISGEHVPIEFTISTQLFFLVANSLLLWVFDFVTVKSVQHAGFAFMGFTFIKAILMFIFLFIATNWFELSKWLMLSFALSYLAHLFFSIYLCLKTLSFYEK